MALVVFSVACVDRFDPYISGFAATGQPSKTTLKYIYKLTSRIHDERLYNQKKTTHICIFHGTYVWMEDFPWRVHVPANTIIVAADALPIICSLVSRAFRPMLTLTFGPRRVKQHVIGIADAVATSRHGAISKHHYGMVSRQWKVNEITN